MKLIRIVGASLGGLIAASTQLAQHFEFPAGCIVRPVVVEFPIHEIRNVPLSIDASARGVILWQIYSIEIIRITAVRLAESTRTSRPLNWLRGSRQSWPYSRT
jgi:hypothetical protein